MFWLVSLRLFIGWHFLFEGINKLISSKWSSAAYLMDSQGWFKGFFYSIASNNALLPIVDCLIQWGLVLIGLGLLMGILSRTASICAIVLLSLYTLSHFSFIGAEYMYPMEGSYLFIDKNLIEMTALVIIYVFPTSHVYGFDRYLKK